MTLEERLERIGLIPLNDIQEELTQSEYLARDPEKSIDQQWQEIFMEG
jgi:hypothetical protein